MINVLFHQSVYPWEDEKYNKRIARLIYFIFVSDIEKNGISIRTFENIIKDFIRFRFQMLYQTNLSTYANQALQVLTDLTMDIDQRIDTDKEIALFVEYIKLCVYYSSAIIRISYTLIDYLTGKTEIDKNQLYNLSIE